ncbi:NmrA family NAD(P)-binding protein [Streptacidiphilus griseoplanus]|uniref:NmrA family NAD(P)-binding protein n=1 Tax=Peterkaempfera griseoplana TaxID=66896 RepID=UPI0006E3B273|nr:NAD(P)H-binding protein [Peterkaempfera griseoplana]
MIVVTAPTAKSGRHVVEQLLDAGEPVRVVVRDSRRLSPTVRDRVEVVEGSHRDAAVVDKAFAGADAVFWLMPNDLRAPDVMTSYVEGSRPGVEAVAAHGVRHVVGVSALGRGTAVAGRAGNVTASLAMDDLFAAVTNYRALANPGFMDNTLRDIRTILSDGVISGPLAPDHKLPLVATRDIAGAAARLLLDRSWTGSAEVPLLGPEDLSGNDMAAVITEVLGIPVRYAQVGPASLEAAMLSFGASPGIARAMADMATAKIDGLDEGVARTTGNSTPTTFRQWCTEVLRPAVDAARSDRTTGTPS